MLVALTGWGQEEDRRRSAEAGFDAHLIKSVDFSALAELLAQAEAGDAQRTHLMTIAMFVILVLFGRTYPSLDSHSRCLRSRATKAIRGI